MILYKFQLGTILIPIGNRTYPPYKDRVLLPICSRASKRLPCNRCPNICVQPPPDDHIICNSAFLEKKGEDYIILNNYLVELDENKSLEEIAIDLIELFGCDN